MLIDSLELVSFFGSTFEKLILGSTDICCWTREGSLFPLSALVEQKESREKLKQKCINHCKGPTSIQFLLCLLSTSNEPTACESRFRIFPPLLRGHIFLRDVQLQTSPVT